jgi:hypothetical protein
LLLLRLMWYRKRLVRWSTRLSAQQLCGVQERRLLVLVLLLR